MIPREIMLAFPFALRYDLTRRQRLGPLLRLWRAWGPVALLCVGGSIAGWIATRSAWFAIPLLLFAYVFRGFFLDLLNVLRVHRQPMDIEVQENGLGFREGDERWWFFLDGLLAFDELSPGVWTVRHFSGSIVHIPTALLTDEQVAFFRTKLAEAEAVRVQQGVPRGLYFLSLFMRGNRLSG
jgi:hypothetical protein